MSEKPQQRRTPREDKLNTDEYECSRVLRAYLLENPTMLLSELLTEFESLNEEAGTLVESHGEEALCGSIDVDSVDSIFLRDALSGSSDHSIGDIVAGSEQACQELEDLIHDFGDEALCGDFRLS